MGRVYWARCYATSATQLQGERKQNTDTPSNNGQTGSTPRLRNDRMLSTASLPANLGSPFSATPELPQYYHNAFHTDPSPRIEPASSIPQPHDPSLQVYSMPALSQPQSLQPPCETYPYGNMHSSSPTAAHQMTSQAPVPISTSSRTQQLPPYDLVATSSQPGYGDILSISFPSRARLGHIIQATTTPC